MILLRNKEEKSNKCVMHWCTDQVPYVLWSSSILSQLCCFSHIFNCSSFIIFFFSFYHSFIIFFLLFCFFVFLFFCFLVHFSPHIPIIFISIFISIFFYLNYHTYPHIYFNFFLSPLPLGDARNAESLGMTELQARKLKKEFLSKHPALTEFRQAVIKGCRYVTPYLR